jgi:hypothetical protein
MVHHARLLLKLLSFRYRPNFKVRPCDYQAIYHTLGKLAKEGQALTARDTSRTFTHELLYTQTNVEIWLAIEMTGARFQGL